MPTAYIVQADLVPAHITEARLAELTQDTVTLATVNPTVVTAIILAASAEVDGYIGRRYALPLASVPELVKQLAIRVTLFRLHGRRPGAMTDALQDDYKDARRMLEEIASGTLTLGVQPEANPSERTIQVAGQDRTFGRSNMSDF